MYETYSLPQLALCKSLPAKMRLSWDIEAMAHLGKTLSYGGVSLEAIKAALGNRLPEIPLDGENSDNFFVAGILAATGSYVFSFNHAPGFQSTECGMGFTKYRITEVLSGRIIMDREFCLQSLHGEVSGFVRHTSNLCYIVSRSLTPFGKERPALMQDVIAVQKDGEIVPTRLKARWLYASPDQNHVATIQVTPTPEQLKIDLYDASAASSNPVS